MRSWIMHMIAGFGEVFQRAPVRTMVSAHDTVDAHLKLLCCLVVTAPSKVGWHSAPV